MDKEGFNMNDEVSIKLYDKNGHLKKESGTRKSRLQSFISGISKTLKEVLDSHD